MFRLSACCCLVFGRGISRTGTLKSSWRFNLRNGSFLLMKSKEHSTEMKVPSCGWHSFYSHDVSWSKCPSCVPSGRAVPAHFQPIYAAEHPCRQFPFSHLSSVWLLCEFCCALAFCSPAAPSWHTWGSLSMADPSLLSPAAHGLGLHFPQDLRDPGSSVTLVWWVPSEDFGFPILASDCDVLPPVSPVPCEGLSL